MPTKEVTQSETSIHYNKWLVAWLYQQSHLAYGYEIKISHQPVLVLIVVNTLRNTKSQIQVGLFDSLVIQGGPQYLPKINLTTQ